MIDLHQLPYASWLLSLNQTNQDHIASYLTLQQARLRSPSTLELILTAIKCLYTCVPQDVQSRLAEDLSNTTSKDIDEWLDITLKQGLAAATRSGRLGLVRQFFDFLKEQGHLTRQPVLRRRHHINVPHRLPRPMTDEDLVTLFRVIDKLRPTVLPHHAPLRLAGRRSQNPPVVGH